MGESKAFACDMSVIVPVYNADPYIARCIASLDVQTASQESFEVILINDGSTDASPKLCRDYANDRQNYTVINQKNAGVSAARNAGIDAARGRYLMFLDPDDQIAPSSVEVLVAAFDSFDDTVDLVTYPLVYHDATSGKDHFHKRQDWLKETGVYDLEEYPFIAQTTINVCVRNDGVLTRHFEEGHKLCEDQRFITEVLSAKARIGYCAEATYVYWRYQDSTASSRPLTSLTFANILENYERYVQLAHKNPRFARYAYALVLYEFGWRFRRQRILPESISLEEATECSGRLVRLLESIPKSSWPESPYLSGMWVLDWALRRRNSLFVKGYFVLPAFVVTRAPQLILSLQGKERELSLKQCSCGLGKPCLDAGIGWEFSIELPRMEDAPYDALLRIVCDDWPGYEVYLRPDVVRCNGRKLEPRIREFDDRRLIIGKDSLRVGTVKDLPVWIMPLARRLMRVRDSFRKGVYADSEIRGLRSYLPKVMRKLRGRRLWLYADSLAREGTGPAFERFCADVRTQDGVERRYVSSGDTIPVLALEAHADKTLVRGSWEHIAWMLASERIVTSMESLKDLLPCDRPVWDRLTDFAANQEYVLLTQDKDSLANLRRARFADTICKV